MFMPTFVPMNSLGPKTGSSQKGRKKKAKDKTKKQSQRGMGVAKLEEQRQKELLGSTPFLNQQPVNQSYVPSSYPGFTSYRSIGQQGFNQRGFGLVNPTYGSSAGLGYYTGSGYGFEGSGFGFSPRELSSIPSLNQVSENGGFGNQKKRVYDERLGSNGMKDRFGIGSEINGSSLLGFDLQKNQFVGAKEEENRVKSPSLASYVGGNKKQDGKKVIMYDFFSKKKSTNPNDDGDDDTPSTSYTTTTTTPSNSTTTSTGSIIYAPIAIDLSLKLSY